MGQVGGCSTTFFFCVLRNATIYRFLGQFWGKFWLMFKKHCKILAFQHIFKSKQRKLKYHFEGSLSGPSRGYYLEQVCCNITKMANFAQIVATPYATNPQTRQSAHHSPLKPMLSIAIAILGWCIFCCSLRFRQFVHHPFENTTFRSEAFCGCGNTPTTCRPQHIPREGCL